jgi:hypothetical protein
VPLSELDGVDADYVERVRNVQTRHEELSEAFLGSSPNASLFHGRPDLVVEVYDSEQRTIPQAVLLGEIKYSDRRQTFRRGLEELLKYIEFAQTHDGEYLSDLQVETHGLLITDEISVTEPSPLDGLITHISAADLASEQLSTEWVPRRLQSIL